MSYSRNGAKLETCVNAIVQRVIDIALAAVLSGQNGLKMHYKLGKKISTNPPKFPQKYLSPSY